MVSGVSKIPSLRASSDSAERTLGNIRFKALVVEKILFSLEIMRYAVNVSTEDVTVYKRDFSLVLSRWGLGGLF